MKDTFEIRDKDGLNRTEHKLYVAMKGLDLNPEKQYKISDMTVDFAFPKEKLVIEVNGEYHKTEEQRKVDKRRWYVLHGLGWKRKTFNANIVNKAPVWCAEKIKEQIYGTSKLLGYPEEKATDKDKKEGKSEKERLRRVKKIIAEMEQARGMP